MLPTLPRRLLTLPMLGVFTALLWGVAPALVVVASAIDAVRGTSVLRALGLMLALTALECVGVTMAGWLWLRSLVLGHDSARLYALQRWWAMSLFRALSVTFGVRLEIEGARVGDGPLLLLPRHVSMVDTLLPIAALGGPEQRDPRYVLKEALQWDPCLDLVGNRLPNAFVRRSTGDPAEVAKVAALAEGLSNRDVVVLYPEGTRFEAWARDKLLANPKHRERAEHFKQVLPPRSGGVLALLKGCEHDVVLMAHHGLDGVTRMKDLLSGGLVGQRVVVRFRRIPRADVPEEDSARVAWLDEVWGWMDQAVQELAGLDSARS